MVPKMRPRPEPRPLEASSLRDLALAYVGRFATTEMRLRRYLARKLRERGWAGEGDPPVDALVAKCVGQGFVDDTAFGEARARSLAGRGYGARRVAASLGAAGIARDTAQAIAGEVDPEAAARRYAERRRFGPWDREPADRDRRQRQLAAMLRAGHSPEIARRVLSDVAGRGGEEDDA